MKIIGERLKTLRRGAGLSQAALAAQIGTKQPAYAHYELGEIMPPYPVLVKLADYYGVSADYLLGRSDDPKSSTFGEKNEDAGPRLSATLSLSIDTKGEMDKTVKELLRDMLEEME